MNARNWGLYTPEQCRAAASGLGANCYANQFARRTVAAEPVRRTGQVKDAHQAPSRRPARLPHEAGASACSAVNCDWRVTSQIWMRYSE